jgi:hypothetical protein
MFWDNLSVFFLANWLLNSLQNNRYSVRCHRASPIFFMSDLLLYSGICPYVSILLLLLLLLLIKYYQLLIKSRYFLRLFLLFSVAGKDSYFPVFS